LQTFAYVAPQYYAPGHQRYRGADSGGGDEYTDPSADTPAQLNSQRW
jgi:hypothetical protein